MSASSKSLFRATKAKARGAKLPMELPPMPAPAQRRAHDFYATGPSEPITGLLLADGDRIRALGSVWEPACGDGAIVKPIRQAGIPCLASDLIDRGCPDSWQADFFASQESPAPAIITNPPYDQISARDGHGRWLRHTLDMPGWRYLALLLSWDWPAAQTNGFGALLSERPFSYCYLLRWKVDFTGEGSPPQRNAWFVWDRDDTRAEPGFRWMDRPKTDARQGALL